MELLSMVFQECHVVQNFDITIIKMVLIDRIRIGSSGSNNTMLRYNFQNNVIS